MSLVVAVIFILTGLFAGLLTGLIGVGGGVVMVPIMYQTFLYLGQTSKVAFTTAVATSLAAIIFSASFATWTHYKNRSLNRPLFIWMGVGILLGAVIGSHLMIASDDRWIRFGFGIFLWAVAASMYLPKAEPLAHNQIPSWRYKSGLIVVGIAMGTASSLFGVGGTALAIPALVVLFGIAIHQAIATGTSLIVLTAVFGTMNYIYLGWHDTNAPQYGLGWVQPIALILLVPAAMLSTRFGIRLASGFSRRTLRNLMVLFQLIVGARFIFF